MPSATTAQVDELYQLPLDEFTAARNALAKESGDGSVKKLEKPSLAAWAVNQLYWRERKLFDEVIKTATQVRTAYKTMLEGKTADVKAADAFHAEAMRRAKDGIRRILEQAGNAATDAVMTPVTETLDALPTTDPLGRLTKPLRRSGFEALQGVTITARPATKPAEIKPKEQDKSTPAQKGSERDAEKRARDQQELAMARERLRFAEAAEREAEASLDRARRALERAERTRERIEAELAEATAAETSARREVRAGESAYAKATAERDRLQKQIKT